MQIAILIFDRLTALDAVGPYEVLSRLPGAELDFVAAEPGAKTTDTGRLSLEARRSIAEVHNPDVIIAPGEDGKVITAAGVSSGIDMALTRRHPSTRALPTRPTRAWWRRCAGSSRLEREPQAGWTIDS